MKIYLLESEDWEKSVISREKVKALIEKYANEAEELLDNPSAELNIIVKPSLPHISSTKGVGGSTYDAELIDITFDPLLPFGTKKFKKYLKEAIFHEMNHALYMKFNPREDRQLYWTILEGLGIVFDTKYADGEHFTQGRATEEDKLAWFYKFNSNSVSHWDTPNDGMMYDTGAWLVMRAEKNSGKNVVELTKLSCDEILRLSNTK